MIYLCPESPSWYQKQGRYDRAFRSLCTLRNTELQAAKELYTAYLQGRVRAKMSEGERSPLFFTKVAELFTIPRIRRATTASYVVMLSQQLCGSMRVPLAPFTNPLHLSIHRLTNLLRSKYHLLLFFHGRSHHALDHTLRQAG